MSEYEREPRGIPGWVKIVGIALLLVALLVVALLLIGGGVHGPQRHLGFAA